MGMGLKPNLRMVNCQLPVIMAGIRTAVMNIGTATIAAIIRNRLDLQGIASVNGADRWWAFLDFIG
jgi:hypothetical protein